LNSNHCHMNIRISFSKKVVIMAEHNRGVNCWGRVKKWTYWRVFMSSSRRFEGEVCDEKSTGRHGGWAGRKCSDKKKSNINAG